MPTTNARISPSAKRILLLLFLSLFLSLSLSLSLSPLFPLLELAIPYFILLSQTAMEKRRKRRKTERSSFFSVFLFPCFFHFSLNAADAYPPPPTPSYLLFGPDCYREGKGEREKKNYVHIARGGERGKREREREEWAWRRWTNNSVRPNCTHEERGGRGLPVHSLSAAAFLRYRVCVAWAQGEAY